MGEVLPERPPDPRIEPQHQGIRRDPVAEDPRNCHPCLRNRPFDGNEVRLDAGLQALLKQQQVEHQARLKAGQVVSWVFVRMVARGRRGKKAPQQITSFTKAWKTACVEAGCPGRIPHDLRPTAVRNMVRPRVPERVAMKLTGHKTASVFQRYNIVSEGDLRTAAAQLSGLTGTEQGQSGSVSPASEAKRLDLFSEVGGAARI